MARPFGWQDAVGEVLANARARPVRTSVVLVVSLAVSFAMLTLTSIEADRIATTSDGQVASGRFAYVISPGETGTITSSDCESLNRVAGVEAAGALISEQRISVVGGSRSARLLTVSEGYVRAAWPRLPVSRRGLIAAMGIAKTLGLRAGAQSIVRRNESSAYWSIPIGATAVSTSRVPGLEDALVEVSAASQPVRQCLVWSDPRAYVAVGKSIVGALGADSLVSDFLPNIRSLGNPQRLLDERLGSYGWALAAAIAVLLVLVTWSADRKDVALYRLLGLRERHVFVMCCADMMLYLVLPLQAALTLVLSAAPPVTLLASQLLWVSWFSALLCALTYPVIAFLIVPRRATVEVLKAI